MGGCAAALNAATSGAGYSVVKDIRYAPGPRGTYDLYLPADAGPKTPIVVFVHGGGWDSGSKDQYLFVGQSLASEGIAVAIPNYRLYPQVRFPAFVEDAARVTAAAVKAARNGAHGQPRGPHPAFLMGHSAGAQIVGLLATDARYLAPYGLRPRGFAGFIGLAGPYDFLPLKEERYKKIFPQKTRAASQPVAFVDGDEPPMLLIAGADDTTVDPKNSRSLAKKVAAAGEAVTATIVPGIDHIGAITSFATALSLGDGAIRRRTIAFIHDHAE